MQYWTFHCSLKPQTGKTQREKNLEISEIILPIFSYHGTGRLWEQENKNSSNLIIGVKSSSKQNTLILFIVDNL